jgi:galactokinase/mevalonate kinase-like predicted kinase
VLFRSWKKRWNEKKNISSQVSTAEINNLENQLIGLGAKAVKLLGAGGSGFLLSIADPLTTEKIKKTFESRVLNFKFDTEGTTCIFRN